MSQKYTIHFQGRENTKARDISGICWQFVSQSSETDMLDNFKEINSPKCVYLQAVRHNHHMFIFNLNEMAWFGH